MNLENKENTSLENVENATALNPKALLAFEEEETKETEIDLVAAHTPSIAAQAV